MLKRRVNDLLHIGQRNDGFFCDVTAIEIGDGEEKCLSGDGVRSAGGDGHCLLFMCFSCTEYC